MMRVFDVETFMTWAHYTLWFVLYPLAFLCEGESVIPTAGHTINRESAGILILLSIPLFDQSQRLSFPLPDFFNFNFSMALVLRCFLLIFFFPSELQRYNVYPHT